jgi:hypothetical protein
MVLRVTLLKFSICAFYQFVRSPCCCFPVALISPIYRHILILEKVVIYSHICNQIKLQMTFQIMRANIPSNSPPPMYCEPP